jgi:excisionase family DNA binding protein
MAIEDNLLSVRQVAFILKVHQLTVRRYIKEGKLKAVKVGGNVRIKESQLSEISKDFSPNPFKRFKNTAPTYKPFTDYDPLLRLIGRGASLDLTKSGI